MAEIVKITTNENYLGKEPQIIYYMVGQTIPPIFQKRKCALFAAAGMDKKINLFSNSLEYMGSFRGHERDIVCLASISNIVSSGSYIWNLKSRAIISTLSNHTGVITALCHPRVNIPVSGSVDKSLIIWEYNLEENSTYPKFILQEHESYIRGIIRLNSLEIISGDWEGNLKIWNIEEGICISQMRIPITDCDGLYQMKMLGGMI